MLWTAKSLSNLPIKSLESGNILGYIKETIIDPENCQLLGFLVYNSFWSNRQKALSFRDIYKFSYQEILVRSDQVITELEEIVRIKNIVEEKRFIIESKVFTQSGKKLGKVSDFVIDTDLGLMVKIYVEKKELWGIMGDLLIISAEQILEIKPRKIIIKDNFSTQELEGKNILEEPIIN